MPPTKKPKISICITQEQKKILEEWAESETRSISNLVNHLIEQGIQKYIQKKANKQ
ncbi:CopG family transcriptional regulator [Scytonema sp. UIC 10036]|uniref:ribbon-helix-helix domain-containing protein n=1 Tax=Scytonema sp. UIC 10036 TaxID=2304196 RepID=UPI0012DA6626|nr:CopG family transcriptional regulator [Scytonema sp. UIC 10036]MUG91651.1 CopG family transcriptional regulator [Scytonema sp. UIC 10036]